MSYLQGDTFSWSIVLLHRAVHQVRGSENERQDGDLERPWYRTVSWSFSWPLWVSRVFPVDHYVRNVENLNTLHPR